MNVQRNRPTIKDVAKAAGVSPTTVSHALNGKGVVSRATSERIHRVAKELGYSPNPLAQSLIQKQFGLIAMILRPLETRRQFRPSGVDDFLKIAGGAALTAMSRGFNLMLVPNPIAQNSPVSTLAADAYIIHAPFENDPVVDFFQSNHMPFLTTGYDFARPTEFPFLDTLADEETVLALEHLRSMGASKIALCRGTDPNSWNLDTERAYKRWCVQYGQAPIVYSFPEELGEEGGTRFFNALRDTVGFRSGIGVDGVFCRTGRQARGFTVQAQAQGVSVPGDVLVVGGTDSEQNRTLSPTTTTLNMHLEETGQLAVEMAVSIIKGTPSQHPKRVPLSTLLVRESTTRTKR